MRCLQLATILVLVLTIASHAQPDTSHINLERQRLLRAVKSGNATARFEAAVRLATDMDLRLFDRGDEWLSYLAKICDRAALPVLLEEFDSQDAARRTRAAIALVYCGARVPAALSLAAAALDSADERLQLLAVDALVRGETTSEAALKTARRLVRTGTPETRKAVVETLTHSPLSPLFPPGIRPAVAGFLLDGLGADDPQVRLRAARGLRWVLREGTDWKFAKPTSRQEALDGLVKLLGEEDAEMRREAFESLCDAAAPRRVIIEGLRDPDARIREQAGWHFRDEGDRARDAGPALVGALEDPVARVRIAAAAALVCIRVEPLPGSVARILLESPKEPDEILRHLAELSLQEMGRSAFRDAVRALSSSSPLRVRTTAAGALACIDIDSLQLSDAEADATLAALLGAIGDEEPPSLRAAAVAALGAFRGKAAESFPALYRLIAEKPIPEDLLKALGNALYRLDTGREAPALVRALLSGVEPASRQALAVLIEMQDRPLEDLPVLLNAAGQADPAVRKRVLRLIQHLASSYRNRAGSILPVLLPMLRDPDPEVQALVMEGLAPFREAAADAIPTLTELLDSKHPRLRGQAAWVLGLIGSKARSAVPRLIALSTEEEADFRRNVVDALGSIGGEDALDTVAAMLRDADPNVRKAAARVLGERAPRKFLPLLVDALDDKDARVRQAVMESLERAGREACIAIQCLWRIVEQDDNDILVRRAAFVAIKHIERSGS